MRSSKFILAWAVFAGLILIHSYSAQASDLSTCDACVPEETVIEIDISNSGLIEWASGQEGLPTSYSFVIVPGNMGGSTGLTLTAYKAAGCVYIAGELLNCMGNPSGHIGAVYSPALHESFSAASSAGTICPLVPVSSLTEPARFRFLAVNTPAK